MATSEKGQVVLITGASSGIGAALAQEWAARGAKVSMLARRKDQLENLAGEIRKRGGEALTLEADVTRPMDLERATQETLKAFGRIDVVVANAGFGVLGSFEKLQISDFERQFSTNVYGVLHTAKATLSELKKTRGLFMIIGSVMGYIATPKASPYAMSKFAVRGLAESLYYEMKPLGVRVKYVAPGFIRTEIHKVNNQGQHISEAKDSVPAWLRMSAEKAAQHIIRASHSHRQEIVITAHGQLIVFLQRHVPWLLSGVMSRFIKEHRAEAH